MAQLWETVNAARDTIGRFMARQCYWFMENYGDPERHPLAETAWLNGGKQQWLLSGTDYAIILTIALVITLLKPLAKNYLFNPVVEAVGIKEGDVERTSESIFQLCYYLPSFVYVFSALQDKVYYARPVLCWEPPFPNQPLLNDEWTVYMMGMGWYCHALFAHVFMDKRTKDFLAMLAHHVVTLALMHASLGMGYHRMGLLAVYSMDSADVFLHVNKLVRYLDNWVNVYIDVLKLIVFPPLVLSWIYFRLYFYSAYVVYPSSVQGVWYAGYENADYWLFFNICLFTLLYLQIFWFYLIMKTALKHLLYGDRLDDERDLSTSGKTNEENKKRAKRKKL
eukprot:TRINITY_DN12617_c0_g1_i1.p1 TRINITY_DN12617_c0_g1~~TRINITY_DN12617_c0_g1_i1.p1  ORF type:complete len:337 (-),score=73.97 TRINITY_DN12617_c0_g1_i1:254-1264(-)